VAPKITSRRFPPPWTVEDIGAAFVVTDSAGQKLAYVYFEGEARRRNATRHQLSGGAGPALLQDGPPFAGQPVSGTML
jgi:hypothetical protein